MLSKGIKALALVAVMGLVLTGCTKKPKIDLSGLRENPAGAGSFAGNGADNGFDGTGFAGAGTEPQFSPVASDNSNGGNWGGLDQPVASLNGENFLINAEAWNEIVYFAYDRAEVSPSERYKLDSLAKVLLAAPEKGVIIEGHCDERGSDEYNRALSERRALSVREYLTTLGVADNAMLTISYGEDKPVVSNARSEAEHQQNRRAQFLIGVRK